VSGNLDVSGTLKAYTYETIVQSSTTYLGSNKFGNDSTDVHEFTGSLSVTGSGMRFTGAEAGAVTLTLTADQGDDSESVVLTAADGGAFTVDSTTSTVTVDGHTGVTITSSNSGEVDITSAANVDINATTGVTIDGTTVSIDGTDDVNLTVTSSTAGEDLTIAQVGANDSSILITAAGTGTDAVSVDATAGDMVVGPSLIDGKTLTLGNTSSTYLKLTPHGTAASEKILLYNAAGTADDAIKIHSDAGGVTIKADNDSLHIDADGTDADALNIDSAGGIDVDAAGAISLDSSAGSIDINVVDGQSVNVGLNGAVETIWSPHGTAGSEVWSTTNTAGTAAYAVALTATAGGVLISAGNTSHGVVVGNVSGAPVTIGHATSETTVSDNLTVTGDLTVNGTTTTINSTTLTVDDLNVVLASGAADSSAADGAGITVDGAGATILYDHTGTQWEMNKPLEIAGNLYPSADDTYDLGSATLAWQDLFLEGDVTLTDAGTIQTTAGALTITAAAASTWSTAAGDLTLDSAAGSAVLDGHTGVTITSSNSGEVDITSAANIDINATTGIAVDATTVSIDGTDDSNLTVTASGKDLDIAVVGGSTQELRLASAGTGTSALHLNASAGGINIDSADMIYIDAEDEIAITTASADGHIAIASAHTAGQSILISANANAGSILDVDAGIIDIDVQDTINIDAADEIEIATTSADGHITLTSAHTAGVAFHIDANADAASEVQIDAGILDIDVTGATTLDTTSFTVTTPSVHVQDTTTTSATEGGALKLSADDGAVMASGHRLGVIEFAGAEDTSNTLTVGARIEALCDATWSASENGASLLFYTTDGNASQSEVLKLDSNKLATFSGTALFSGNATFGVDDTGVDVRFFSQTASEGVLYDASEDELALLLTTKLKFHDVGGGEEIFASANGHLEINAGTTLDVTAPTVDINASTAVTVDTPSVTVTDTTTSSATEGGAIRLVSNDGAAMADDHRLGVVEFAGAEDGSSTITVGARIEAICDAGWSASENGAALLFYTTDGNASQSEVLRLDSDKLATFAGATLFSGNATFGVDDTGVDVRFFSQTASEGVLYDASEDELALLLTTKLKFHDVGGGEEIFASANGHLEVNAGTTLDMTAPTVDINASTAVTIDSDTITFGSANSQDPLVVIKNTTNDAEGASLRFVKDKGSAGADGDIIGAIQFVGDDAAQTQTMFAKIVAAVSEADDTDEAGKLSLYVAESDGTTTALTAGLVLEGEHATDGQVDVTLGAGAASTTTVAGLLAMGDDNKLTFGALPDASILYDETVQDKLIISGSAGGTHFSMPSGVGSAFDIVSRTPDPNTGGNPMQSYMKFHTNNPSIEISAYTTFKGGDCVTEADYHMGGGAAFEDVLSSGANGTGDILKYGPAADTTLTLGQLYYLKSDGVWTAADANAAASGKSLLGIALGASARDNGMLLRGFVRIPSTEVLNLPGSGASDGLPVYISSTTAGHFDFTAPSGGSDVERVVGYCVDDDSGDILLWFSPDGAYTTH